MGGGEEDDEVEKNNEVEKNDAFEKNDEVEKNNEVEKKCRGEVSALPSMCFGTFISGYTCDHGGRDGDKKIRK